MRAGLCRCDRDRCMVPGGQHHHGVEPGLEHDAPVRERGARAEAGSAPLGDRLSDVTDRRQLVDLRGLRQMRQMHDLGDDSAADHARP